MIISHWFHTCSTPLNGTLNRARHYAPDAFASLVKHIKCGNMCRTGIQYKNPYFLYQLRNSLGTRAFTNYLKFRRPFAQKVMYEVIKYGTTTRENHNFNPHMIIPLKP